MDKKSLQLGLDFGTATGRLHRQILFMFVKESGRDKCFRCRKQIERWEDFSVDHKKDWQDVDPALFWDLENIAFSHKSCNSRAGRKYCQHQRAKNAPMGQAWCTGHQCYHDEKEFGKCKTQPNGLHYYCRAYRQSIGWEGGKYKPKLARSGIGRPNSLENCSSG